MAYIRPLFRFALCPLVLLCTGCVRDPAGMKTLEFLTRDGCAQTALMRGRLDEAIGATPRTLTYSVVDLDALAATDARRAYPTPTILYGGVDLFGMAEPRPPFDEPT